jgi:hypothetical protein
MFVVILLCTLKCMKSVKKQVDIVRRLKLERSTRATDHLLRYANGSMVVPQKLPEGIRYHIFLSHKQDTGNNQVLACKDQLNIMCPTMEVFLECAACDLDPPPDTRRRACCAACSWPRSRTVESCASPAAWTT